MAPKISTEKMFRRRQKIAAAVELPGVPVGTFGKVWFVSGVTWIRYHVAFDNGVEIANVDGAQINLFVTKKRSRSNGPRLVK